MGMSGSKDRMLRVYNLTLSRDYEASNAATAPRRRYNRNNKCQSLSNRHRPSEVRCYIGYEAGDTDIINTKQFLIHEEYARDGSMVLMVGMKPNRQNPDRVVFSDKDYRLFTSLTTVMMRHECLIDVRTAAALERREGATLMICHDQLDSHNRLDTTPNHRDVLRTVWRSDTERADLAADAKTVSDVEVKNLLYRKVNPNVRSLKRMRLEVRHDDGYDDSHEPTRFLPDTRTQMVLHFRPEKRTRYASEQTFQLACNKPLTLPRPYKLWDQGQQLELGIIDLWMTNHFHTLTGNEAWFSMIDWTDGTDKSLDNYRPEEADKQYIPSGRYVTHDELALGFNNTPLARKHRLTIEQRNDRWWLIDSLQKHPELSYKKVLVFSPLLAEMWGHSPRAKPVGYLLGPGGDSHRISGTNKYDIYAGFELLYVYCNLVKPSIVGDVTVQFLEQIVPKFDANGEYYTEVSNPYYAKLLANIDDISRVAIWVTDSLGRPLVYDQQHRTPEVTLHMRVSK